MNASVPPLCRLGTRILCLLCVCAMLSGITGCGSVSTPGGMTGNGRTAVSGEESVDITLWHPWASDTDANRAPFLKVLDDLKTAYPNYNLLVEESDAKSHDTKIKTAAAANRLPDVFYYLGGGILKNLVDNGRVLPLDDALQDGTKARILPGTLTNYTFDNRTYALPYTLACAVFYVNTDLFEQHNVAIPDNYETLLAAVRAFREKGITPMAVGAKDEWPTTQYFDLISVRQAGYETVAAALNKTGSWEDPGIIEAARKFQELVSLGAFPDNAIDLTRDASEVPFYEGKIPMYVNGNWVTGNIQREDSKIKDKVLALKFPDLGGEGDLNDFTGGAADMFAVASASKHPQEAVNVCKFITENHSREAFLAGAGLPTWAFSFDEAEIDPLVLQVVRNTQEARTFTLWWNSHLESKDADYYHNAVTQLFALTITPEQFARNMQLLNRK